MSFVTDRLPVQIDNRNNVTRNRIREIGVVFGLSSDDRAERCLLLWTHESRWHQDAAVIYLRTLATLCGFSAVSFWSFSRRSSTIAWSRAATSPKISVFPVRGL